MTPSTLTPELIQSFQQLASDWGKIIARRIAQDHGIDSDLDFQSMEQIASAAAQGLIQGTLQALIEQQNQKLDPQQHCPQCDRLCTIDFQDRPLNIPGGQLSLQEPVAHCPDCRRDFFSSAPGSGPGQP